jgi:hypothetical protein
VSQAAASTPGALLRHNTWGPRHGRPAIGDLIAYSTGESATAQTNPATTAARSSAIRNNSAHANRVRTISQIRTVNSAVNSSTGV